MHIVSELLDVVSSAPATQLEAHAVAKLLGEQLVAALVLVAVGAHDKRHTLSARILAGVRQRHHDISSTLRHPVLLFNDNLFPSLALLHLLTAFGHCRVCLENRHDIDSSRVA